MVTPHCFVGGHVGFSGGRGFGGMRNEEEFTWTGERLGGRGSAGKARVPANNDSATASTPS